MKLKELVELPLFEKSKVLTGSTLTYWSPLPLPPSR